MAQEQEAEGALQASREETRRLREVEEAAQALLNRCDIDNRYPKTTARLRRALASPVPEREANGPRN